MRSAMKIYLKQFVHIALALLIVSGLTGCYGTIHMKEEDSEEKKTIDTQSVKRGQQIYQDQCQACHGESAAGDGEKADQFDPKPANLLKPGLHITTTGLESIVDFPHYSSEAIRRRIRHGAADMPGFKDNFNETEVLDIVNYLKFRQLQAPETEK
jgi:mono/diheme cytochrome c family protein